jgi:FkbM family methyltransferase
MRKFQQPALNPKNPPDPMKQAFDYLMQNALPPYARSAAMRWLLRRWRSVRADRGKKAVLVYVGMHKGREFDMIFKDYRTCYGFEANPELYALLVDKYKAFPHVRLFNRAATTSAGPVTFNISSNAGASSSLGSFDDQWDLEQAGAIRMERQVTVDGVNLGEFLEAEGVSRIDDYVSDIQGMDLAVLQTLKRWIDEKRIDAITVEVASEAKRNMYKGLPSNAESGFLALLGANYRLVAIGYGVLQDYWFGDVPTDAWEADCKWRLKG